MTTADRRARQVAAVARPAAPEEPDAPLVVLRRWRDDDLVDDAALDLLDDVARAHGQLRELRLESAWQRSFGWFVARSVVVFGMLVIFAVAFAPDAVPFASIVAALAGVGLFYVVIVLTAPFRLRRHRRIRAHCLATFHAALDRHRDG